MKRKSKYPRVLLAHEAMNWRLVQCGKDVFAWEVRGCDAMDCDAWRKAEDHYPSRERREEAILAELVRNADLAASRRRRAARRKS